MRLEQQNRRSCIVLLILLAGLIALITWMSLGGISSQTVGDDVKADVVPQGGAGGTAPVVPAPQKSGS
jgi:hypothetical protein